MTKPLRCVVALFAIAMLGAASKEHAATSTGVHRPSFVEATRNDRFAPNAIRRARLTFLMPATMSATAQKSALAHGGAATTASTYKVLNLDALIAASGTTIDPLALNNDGRIVGGTNTTFDGQDYPGYLINNNGSNAFLASLGYYYNNYADYFPTSISNKGGTVAGFTDLYVNVAGGLYYYTDSEVWTLTGVTGSTLAYYHNRIVSDSTYIADIANGNVPVGGHYYWTSIGQRTPFPIDNCPVSDFYANAIDDSGTIVGYSYDRRATVLTLGGCPTSIPNVTRGFVADAVASNGDMLLQNGSEYDLWAKGVVSRIPLPSGYAATTYAVDAVALNASDVVVGNVVAKDGTPVAAFEYQNGKSVNVQTLFPANSGWVALAVTGINDRSEIIGDGYVNGVRTAFALRH